MRSILGGLLVLCLIHAACTDPRKPDLSSLLSPSGADACAEQVSVGSGIVHVLAVIHEAGRPVSACGVAQSTLQPIAGSVKAEYVQEIRGIEKCQLVGYPAGRSSDQVFKMYVFSDGSADGAARKVCDHLQSSADPSFDFQNT